MRYGVLLRGINVGGKRVEMLLKQCLEEAGLSKVVTLLNSGNVVFDTTSVIKTELQALIAKAIAMEFGFDIGIFLYTIDELEQIVRAYPFDRGGASWHAYAIFTSNGIGPELMELASSQLPATGSWSLGEGVVYWRTPKGTTITSDFSKFLTKARFKTWNTVRNLNTIEKMVNIGSRD